MNIRETGGSKVLFIVVLDCTEALTIYKTVLD